MVSSTESMSKSPVTRGWVHCLLRVLDWCVLSVLACFISRLPASASRESDHVSAAAGSTDSWQDVGRMCSSYFFNASRAYWIDDDGQKWSGGADMAEPQAGLQLMLKFLMP